MLCGCVAEFVADRRGHQVTPKCILQIKNLIDLDNITITNITNNDDVKIVPTNT